MKKDVKQIFILFILTISLTNFTSATLSLYEGMTEVWNNINLILNPILQFFLGDISGALLLNKILIFLIILLLSWIGLKKSNFLSEYPIISKVIVFAVAILAMKGIGSSTTINTILLPYTATGIALSAGFPFIIYFLVVNKGFGEQSPIIRRIAWIFFGVIFVGLTISRIGFENLLDSSSWGFYWIYILTAIIAFIMAIIDGTIQGFFAKAEADKLKNINNTEIAAEMNTRLHNWREMVRQGTLKPLDYERLKKREQRRAKIYGIKKLI